MRKPASARAAIATAILALATPSLGCQVDFLDENGNPTDPPTLDENIAASTRTFVGTVKGWRTYSGDVLEQSIDCWDDETVSREDCDALLNSIMSVILSVDHAIRGIEAGRLYEELYGTGDGDCGPYFQYGRRYIYNTGIFGVEELPLEPSDKLLEHWRNLKPPEARHADVLHRQYERQCTTGDDAEVLADLAESTDAFVATVRSVRTDDTKLTEDLSVCVDQGTEACSAFAKTIVSVRIDIEHSIKADASRGLEVGEQEIGFWPVECPLPVPGQQYLIGGFWNRAWVSLDQPRKPLSRPPSDAQLAAWRAAAALGS